MERCIIYSRESGASTPLDDQTFASQEATCREAAAQRGYTVVDAVREAKSGATLDRSTLVEVCERVKAGEAEVLLARHTDRLTRNGPGDLGVIRWWCGEKQGQRTPRVETVWDLVDRNDPDAAMMFDVSASIAAKGKRDAVQRMQTGRGRRAERGVLLVGSNARYGWRWDDDEVRKRTRYVADEVTAPIVRRIYDLWNAGHSMRFIARLLTAEGAPTPAAYAAKHGYTRQRTDGKQRHVGTGWTPQQVSRILTNPAYAGHGASKVTMRVPTTNGKSTPKPRPDGVLPLQEGVWPALVNEEVWQAAQALLATRSATHEGKGRPPLDREATWLRQHVYCGVCGHKMVAQRATVDKRHTTQSRHVMYQCHNHTGNKTQGGEACKAGGHSIRAHMLDGEAYHELREMLAHREELQKLLLDRLGVGKIEALTRMADSYNQQLTAKREEADTARRRARQTTDDTLAADFIHDAEVLTAEVRDLETAFTDALVKLDSFNAGNAWIQSLLDRVYVRATSNAGDEAAAAVLDAVMPQKLLTVADVQGFPYEERRVLLAILGVHVNVWPVGWREDGKRITVECHPTETSRTVY